MPESIPDLVALSLSLAVLGHILGWLSDGKRLGQGHVSPPTERLIFRGRL